MDQAIRVEQAQKNKRLIALAIDLVILAVSTFSIFFFCLYVAIGPAFKYNDRVKTIDQYTVDYELTLKEGEDYTKYEEVIRKFYFEYFTDEIMNTIETNFPNEHYESITHLYNVYVLSLPYSPKATGDNYKGELFEYQIDKETGEVLKNELGVTRPDYSGKVYERNLRDYMYSLYVKLGGFLDNYKADYHEARVYKNNVELTSRTVAIGMSVIIFTIVVPLFIKNGQTIGDKIAEVAYVTNKGGFRIKPYHTVLRSISLYSLPILGLAIYDKYSVIALLIFPIFISTLLFLFRQSERDIRDLLSGTLAIDKRTSLIFKSLGEARLYEKKEENQVVEDPEYLEKLKNAAQVELETSRDEQFKNKQKKN